MATRRLNNERAQDPLTDLASGLTELLPIVTVDECGLSEIYKECRGGRTTPTLVKGKVQ